MEPIKSVEIECRGRGPRGENVLRVPIHVVVGLFKPYPRHPEEIEAKPTCPYLTGGHGQRCKASHPNQDKVGDGVFCIFRFDYSRLVENYGDAGIPIELLDAINEIKSP